MTANGPPRHPGKLPSHLDMDLYTEFLSMQPPVFTAMEEHILKIGRDDQALTELRRAFHTLKGEAGFFRLEAVENLCHMAEDALSHDIFPENLIALLLDIQAWLRNAFAWYAGKSTPAPQDPGDLRMRLLEETGKAQDPTISTRKNPDSRPPRQVRENVLVESERLDRLMDTIGELVIVETMVRQSPELAAIGPCRLSAHLSQLTKLTRELQGLGLGLRMVPIRPLFMKMERMVQELGRTLGKSVLFQSFGEETELDRSLVERLRDPLLHLVRNAMDHGIEDQETRQKKGKPEKGFLRIEASHRGGDIHIRIQDDGQGLDADAIASKAKKKGLLSHDNVLSKEEIQSLIFTSGFSTAPVLTEISGRGLGLDVVREQIVGLSGEIRVESQKDAGVTFHMRIPMTVAIIDGIVCRCGKRRYVLPTLCVLGSLALLPEALCILPSGMTLAPFHDQLIPASPLEILLQKKDQPTKEGRLMIVIESDGSRAGILVEEILGKQQIVVKSLGETFRGIQGISGAAIMPDGEVGLILDPQALIRQAFHPDSLAGKKHWTERKERGKADAGT